MKSNPRSSARRARVTGSPNSSAGEMSRPNVDISPSLPALGDMSTSWYAGPVPKWLTREEDAAWRGYRRMRLLLDLQIARDLVKDSGLSEADYDVLSTLSETAGRRMRLSDLAAHMLWSKSRLSHHTA